MLGTHKFLDILTSINHPNENILNVLFVIECLNHDRSILTYEHPKD